jgi:hypothetical protein
MSDGWFYAEAEKTVGPISLEELENILSIVPDPYNLRVWKAGLSEWTVAGSVKEVVSLIRTPPRLPETRRKQASEIKLPPLNAPPSKSQNPTAGIKSSSSSVKRPWSLLRAALSGLLVMVVVSAFHSPHPWSTVTNLETASHWIGYFAGVPILFVALAAIRNLSVIGSRDRVGRGLFRAWVVVSGLWIAGAGLAVYYAVVPDRVHGDFQAVGRVKEGVNPSDFNFWSKPFYELIRSPSAEKLTVTFERLDWQRKESFDKDTRMVKIEVGDTGHIYMPADYNSVDRSYIVKQFEEQRLWRWADAALIIALWALVPCIALFIFGYALLWIGRGFTRGASNGQV